MHTFSQHTREVGATGYCDLFSRCVVPPAPCSTAQHVGSQFPDQGSNPHPLQWKHEILTTDHQGSPSRLFFFLNKGCTFFFFLSNLFIYLFLAALGLHCCVPAFSSCSERGLLFVAVRRLLIVVASLVAEHGL